MSRLLGDVSVRQFFVGDNLQMKVLAGGAFAISSQGGSLIDIEQNPPASPDSVSVTPRQDGQSATVSWSDVTGAGSYKVLVYEADTGSLFQTWGGVQETTKVIYALSSETTYFVGVRAVDASGTIEGDATMSATFQTPDVTPPDPVSQLAASAGVDGGTVDLSWTASGSSDLASYTVTTHLMGTLVHVNVTVNGDGKFVLDPVPTLSTGSVYVFVQEDSSNSGHPLRFSSDGASQALYSSLMFEGTPGTSGAKVTLIPEAEGTAHPFCTAHGYGMGSLYGGMAVSAGTTTQASEQTGITDASYQVTGLTSQRVYRFDVAAVDTSANASTTESVTAHTPDVTPPSQVTGLTVTPESNGTHVQADWTEVDTGFTYRLRVIAVNNVDVLQDVQGITTNSYLITGLTSETTYRITVAAVDLSGNEGDQSDQAVAVTPDITAPAKVTGVVATPSDNGRDVSVAFTTAADVDVYTVRIYESDQVNVAKTSTGNSGSPVVVGGLDQQTTYYAAVTAIDAAGNVAEQSDLVEFATTADTTAPDAPTNFSGTFQDNNIAVDFVWTASASTDVASYTLNIYLADDTLLQTITGITGTSHTLEGLTSETEADYKADIKAVDVAGLVGTPTEKILFSRSGWATLTADDTGTSLDPTVDDGSITDTAFSEDGLTMYAATSAPPAVYEYSLTTAYDVSTATQTSSYTLSDGNMATNIESITFNEDGTVMYLITHGSPNKILFYNMTSAFDLSTATYETSVDDIYEQNTGNVPKGMDYYKKGNKEFLMVTGDDGSLFTVEVTPGSRGKSRIQASASLDYNYDSIQVKPDGRSMWATKEINGVSHIFEYRLTTPFDLSSISLVNSNSLGRRVSGIHLDKRRGRKLFLAERTTNRIHEYQASEDIPTLLDPPATVTTSANPNGAEAEVSWTAVGGAASYVARLFASNGTTLLGLTTGIAGTLTSFSGLTSETTYYATVAAHDGNNQGPQSSQVPFTTPDVTAPDPITDPSVSATSALSTDALVQWTTNADIATHIVKVYSPDDSTLVTTASGVTGNAYTATGLSGETTYYFSVTPVDAAGNAGSESAKVSLVSNDVSAPEVSTGLALTQLTGSSVRASWTAPSGEAPASYKARIYDGAGPLSGATAHTYLDFEGDDTIVFDPTGGLKPRYDLSGLYKFGTRSCNGSVAVAPVGLAAFTSTTPVASMDHSVYGAQDVYISDNYDLMIADSNGSFMNHELATPTLTEAVIAYFPPIDGTRTVTVNSTQSVTVAVAGSLHGDQTYTVTCNRSPSTGTFDLMFQDSDKTLYSGSSVIHDFTFPEAVVINGARVGAVVGDPQKYYPMRLDLYYYDDNTSAWVLIGPSDRLDLMYSEQGGNNPVLAADRYKVLGFANNRAYSKYRVTATRHGSSGTYVGYGSLELLTLDHGHSLSHFNTSVANTYQGKTGVTSFTHSHDGYRTWAATGADRKIWCQNFYHNNTTTFTPDLQYAFYMTADRDVYTIRYFTNLDKEFLLFSGSDDFLGVYDVHQIFGYNGSNGGALSVHSSVTSSSTGISMAFRAIDIDTTGTRIFAAPYSGTGVVEFSLSSPYDISTCYPTGRTFDVTYNVRSISMSWDQKHMFLVDASTDYIHDYQASTAMELVAPHKPLSYSAWHYLTLDGSGNHGIMCTSGFGSTDGLALYAKETSATTFKLALCSRRDGPRATGSGNNPDTKEEYHDFSLYESSELTSSDYHQTWIHMGLVAESATVVPTVYLNGAAVALTQDTRWEDWGFHRAGHAQGLLSGACMPVLGPMESLNDLVTSTEVYDINGSVGLSQSKTDDLDGLLAGTTTTMEWDSVSGSTQPYVYVNFSEPVTVHGMYIKMWTSVDQQKIRVGRSSTDYEDTFSYSGLRKPNNSSEAYAKWYLIPLKTPITAITQLYFKWYSTSDIGAGTRWTGFHVLGNPASNADGYIDDLAAYGSALTSANMYTLSNAGTNVLEEAAVTDTTATFTGLSEGSSYSVIVMGVDSNGNVSTATAPESILMNDLTAPQVPPGVSLSTTLRNYTQASQTDIGGGYYPHGITFSPDGTKAASVSVTNDRVREYTLSTGFNFSTRSNNTSWASSTQIQFPRDIAFDPTGYYLYVSGHHVSDGTSGRVVRYTLSTQWDAGTGGAPETLDLSALGVHGGYGCSCVLGTDGTEYLYVLTGETGALSAYQVNQSSFASSTLLGTSSDLVAIVNTALGTSYEKPHIIQGVAVSKPGTRAYVTVYNSDKRVVVLSMSTPYDPRSISEVEGVIYVSNTSEDDCTGIHLKEDESLIMLCNKGGTSNNVIRVDLSNAGFDSVVASSRTTDQNVVGYTEGFDFNLDHTELYAIGTDRQSVDFFDLGTGADITTVRGLSGSSFLVDGASLANYDASYSTAAFAATGPVAVDVSGTRVVGKVDASGGQSSFVWYSIRPTNGLANSEEWFGGGLEMRDADGNQLIPTDGSAVLWIKSANNPFGSGAYTSIIINDGNTIKMTRHPGSGLAYSEPIYVGFSHSAPVASHRFAVVTTGSYSNRTPNNAVVSKATGGDASSDPRNLTFSQIFTYNPENKSTNFQAWPLDVESEKLTMVQLSTAWDASTAGAATNSSTVLRTNFSRCVLGAVEDSAQAEYGKLFFLLGDQSEVTKYTATSAFNMNGGTWTTEREGLSGNPRITFAQFFSGGMSLGVYESTTDTLRAYSLGSRYSLTEASWDISSPTYTVSSATSTLGLSGNIAGVSWVSSGGFAFVTDTSGTVKLFDALASPYDYRQLIPANEISSGTPWAQPGIAMETTSGKLGLLHDGTNLTSVRHTGKVPVMDIDLGAMNHFAVVGNSDLTKLIFTARNTSGDTYQHLRVFDFDSSVSIVPLIRWDLSSDTLPTIPESYVDFTTSTLVSAGVTDMAALRGRYKLYDSTGSTNGSLVTNDRAQFVTLDGRTGMEIHDSQPERSMYIVGTDPLYNGTRVKELMSNTTTQNIWTETYNFNQGPYTVAAYVRLTSRENHVIVGMHGSHWSEPIQISLIADKLRPNFWGHMGGAYKQYVADIDLSLNTWYHLAFTFDSGTVACYVDGVYVAPDTANGGTSSFGSPGNALSHPDRSDRYVHVGGKYYHTVDGPLFYLSDLRFYGFALTAGQVLEAYQGTAPSTKTLSLRANRQITEVTNGTSYDAHGLAYVKDADNLEHVYLAARSGEIIHYLYDGDQTFTHQETSANLQDTIDNLVNENHVPQDIYNVWVSPDGAKLFTVLYQKAHRLCVFSMSTPFDVSTATLAGYDRIPLPRPVAATELRLNAAMTKLWVSQGAHDDESSPVISQFNLAAIVPGPTAGSSPQARLSWTPDSDAASYVVNLYGPSGTTVLQSTPGVTDNVYYTSGLTAGQQYYLAVASVDAAGNQSAFSSLLSLVPPDYVAPDPVSDLAVARVYDAGANSTTFTASWTPDSDTASVTVRLVDPDGVTVTESQESYTGTSYEFQTVTGTGSYSVHVIPFDLTGNQGAQTSAEAYAGPAMSFTVSGTASYSSSNNTSTVTVRFRDVSNYTDSPSPTFEVFRNSNQTGLLKTQSANAESINTTFSETLTPIQTRTYYVRMSKTGLPNTDLSFNVSNAGRKRTPTGYMDVEHVSATNNTRIHRFGDNNWRSYMMNKAVYPGYSLNPSDAGSWIRNSGDDPFGYSSHDIHLSSGTKKFMKIQWKNASTFLPNPFYVFYAEGDTPVPSFNFYKTGTSTLVCKLTAGASTNVTSNSNTRRRTAYSVTVYWANV